jgi:hypothetical protein
VRRLLLGMIGVLVLESSSFAYQGANAGYFNTNFANAGYFNAGYFNAGYFNAGYFNAGYFNAGYFNAGYFNGANHATRVQTSGALTQGAWAHQGNAFSVTPGQAFTVEMTGTGDADLYVRWGAQPHQSAFDCRPYYGSSNETCALTVPQGVTTAYVSVHGYSWSSTFELTIRGFNVSLAGMKTNAGHAIDNVYLDGTALRGTAWVLETGWTTECEEPYGCWQVYNNYWVQRALTPQEFVGATQQITVVGADQSVVGVADLRIAGVQQLGGGDSDTYLYTLEAYLGQMVNNQVQWSWVPMCGKENGVPIKAIPLQGTWNYQSGVMHGGAKINNSANQVTWACVNGALGKCAGGKSMTNGLGYKPSAHRFVWQNQGSYTCGGSGYNFQCFWQDNWVVVWGTMADIHQTCTRMVRADYCGDGTPHTVTGRQLDVWDNLAWPVNDRDYGVNLPPGAIWAPDGASVMGCARVDALWPDGSVCPTYFLGNGVTHQHQFQNYCPVPWDSSAPNVIINTNATWGTTAEAPYPTSILGQ